MAGKDKTMKIHIVLPVHNRLEKTRLFIDSLLAQTYNNYHLILIDDGSTDGTQDYVKSKVKNLTVITGSGDWWWGGGLHQGYVWLKKNHASADDLVLLINNDTEFAPDFFQIAVGLMARNPRTLLLARAYSRQGGRFVGAGVHVDWRHLTFNQQEDGEINCFSTRGLFLRVGDFMDIGGFHPVLLPHYLSDYEFTIRAHRKGYTLVTDLVLRLTTDETTTGHRDLSGIVSRNEFVQKYFSKRSVDNPVYWASFVLLACPWPWKPVHLSRVIYGGIKICLGKFLRCV